MNQTWAKPSLGPTEIAFYRVSTILSTGRERYLGPAKFIGRPSANFITIRQNVAPFIGTLYSSLYNSANGTVSIVNLYLFNHTISISLYLMFVNRCIYVSYIERAK